MKIRKTHKTLLLAALFFVIVTAFFYLLLAGTMPKYKTVSSPEEIKGTDLSKDYICIDASSGQTFGGRLYTPKDFKNGNVAGGDENAKFETVRIVLHLKSGKTYGITGDTATYAQNVYINGELSVQTGTVSDSPEKFVPKTDRYTVYFTPQTDETEIIIQHAWFNHVSGAVHKLYVAENQVIAKCDRTQNLSDGLITGSLLAMAIFFFGMFLFHPKRRSMLWFSLSCLCAAVHYLIYESKQIMAFFPNLNWYIGHKTENITNYFYFLFIALFAVSMLRLKLPKWVCGVTLGVFSLLTLFYITAPSSFYTKFIVPVGAAVIVFFLFLSVLILISAIKNGLFKGASNIIVCMTVIITAGVYVVESLTYFSHIFYIRSYAVILFAFCNAVVLTIGFSQAEQNLNNARQREHEISESNAALEQMNRLKNDFMHNIAHEMKTPLAVMSGYAQLTEREIQKGTQNSETLLNLQTVSKEAQRLSDMVTKLLSVTYSDAAQTQLSRLDARKILDDAAAVCRPILSKRNNVLKIICSENCEIIANREALLQVLINLAVNSGKHTENGTVAFLADEKTDDEFIHFRVTDTGGGISADILPHVFEKGRSNDGGNGLGLGICREIIETMRGRIEIEKTDLSGTTVHFTVPSGKDNI